jgi:hypothetical protein
MKGGQNAAEQTVPRGRAGIVDVLKDMRTVPEAPDGSEEVSVPKQRGRPC